MVIVKLRKKEDEEKWFRSMNEKDTKKSKTWWCLDAPIKPRIEIKIKMIPQANIPPTIGKLVTIDAARPYTPTPINRNPTIYKE